LHNGAGDDAFKESTDFLVMPAKAGISQASPKLDSRFRGNDKTAGCDWL
jgi:hypothetical protein